MSTFQKFAIGGLGGLLPVLVSLYSFDVASVIDNWHTLTLGHIVGYLIKVIILIGLGGTVAALNCHITNPWLLAQLGIAAPALITSYINGTGVAGPEKPGHATSGMAVISAVYAAEASDHVPIVPAGFLRDVLEGATVPLPKIQRQRQQQQQQQQQPQQRQQQERGQPDQQHTR